METEQKYEYLDHTADIQVHAWGDSLEEAFIEASHAMLNYMYEFSSAKLIESKELIVAGNSLNRLLYNFLEEVLLVFSCDPYMAIGKVEIQSLRKDQSEAFRIKFTCQGEEYSRKIHGSKTEIKAVTYSNMRIFQDEQTGRHHIYVIFDI